VRLQGVLGEPIRIVFPVGSRGVKIGGKTIENDCFQVGAWLLEDPPTAMVRTSRNGAPAANVDALDNIDLDDMFADDGDALFDGLDIDLDMDDLAGGDLDTQQQDRTSVAAPSRRSLEVPPPAPAVAAAPASAASTRSRRTTKRKSKLPAFLDDAADEDFIDEPAPKKKRRRTTKATTTAAAKKKGAKAVPTSAAAAAAVSAAALAAATAKATKAAKTAKGKATATKGKGKTKTASSKVATKVVPAAMQAPSQQLAGRAGSSSASAATTASMSATSVAAVGRFGGQLQQTSKARATSFSAGGGPGGVAKPPRAKLPMATKGGKAGRAQSIPGNSAAAAVAANAANIAQLKATHPGLKLGTYCGIQPSNTLFYPFLPALPPEPTMKTRKTYPMVDRIHTSFQNHLQQSAAEKMNTSDVTPCKETEPIFQLMQEAYKEEKLSAGDDNNNNPMNTSKAAAAAATRVHVVGHAIGALRKTIQQLEVPKLAVDWYAVCALLQRQHDFLKINASNMERWCKEHLPPEDYAAIYLEPEPSEPAPLPATLQQSQQQLSKKRKAGEMEKGASLSSSILLCFGKPEFRVKVNCTGFKEPKGAGPLAVSLPQSFLPESMRPKEKTKKTKKRKTAATSAAAATTKAAAAAGSSEKTSSSTARSSTTTTKEPLPYVNMKPAKRRKQIADLLTRTAGELENANLQHLDARREAEDREETSLRKLIEDDAVPVSHTTGMWKWLELSGYFKEMPESEIRRMLDDVRSPEVPLNAHDSTWFVNCDDRKRAATSGSGKSDPTTSDDVSIFDRLQSLLVDEDGDDDAMERDDDAEEQIDDVDFEELYTVAETLDMSMLSLEERSSLHLQSFGLGDELAMPQPLTTNPGLGSGKTDGDFLLQNGETNTTSFSPTAGKNSENVSMNGSLSTATTEKVVHAELATSEPSVAVKQQPEGIPSSSMNGDVSVDLVTASVSKQPQEDFGPSELDQAIRAMTAELVAVNEVNNRRTSFLQTVSTACCVSSEQQKLKNDQESNAISRCQALLKKTKEMKAKSGKMASTQDDSLALPW